MIEKNLPALIFGNVVLESNLLGCSVRIYADDKRSYSMRSNPNIELKVPLDELRKNISPEVREDIARKIFRGVEAQLENSYPGGVDRAVKELYDWLSAKS